ncbi:TPA: phage tail assembly protein [Salmonella enterica]|uniref:Phage tail assembly protein n=1 Tax=Salmonella enterica TaxID=28901 RepID=A0A750HZ26_SALER|nr:phage tail assembly protein [Salmonella enterica]
MTGKGTLLYGIEHDGRTHYDFEIRIPVMADVYTALDQAERVHGNSDSGAGDLYYRMALMALVLTRLGELPAQDITPELLLSGLLSEDYERLNEVIAALKKKRRNANAGDTDCASPSLPSDNTASAKNG